MSEEYMSSIPVYEIEPKNENVMRSRRRRRHSSGGDRDTWSRKFEYFFASLGYAVGLGNIWRFPYLCYRNGGGAFLIPYIMALVGVGFPIIFLEMAFGQFASLGTITIWRVCPLFKGIGFAIVIVLIMVNTYYNVLIAYALYYLFASITNQLPWASCNNDWNTKYCTTKVVARYVSDISGSTSDVSGYFNDTNVTTMSPLDEAARKLLKTPTEEYFERHLLGMTEGIHDLGNLQWPLIVCLGVSWFTCFICLFKGIKSMGKAVIFTTIFSYLVLTVLLIRGVTLPGARDGIIYYLKPDFTKLRNLQVWGEAFSQAVASLTLGGGGWITLSSYSKFSNRCNRDAVLVGIGNALTSFYAGFVIFSVLGYMAFIKGVPVDMVTARGPGLAFVAYPEGLALIPGAPFWAICFFFMMFTVGLDSLFGQVETIAAGITDEYPEFLRPRRREFTLVLCIFMFLLGMPMLTQGGIFIVTLLDWYTLLFSFSIICLFEIIVIIYIYGYRQFAGDIEIMLGTKPNLYYAVCWLFVSPTLLICVIAFLARYYVPAYYGNYSFPKWAEDIGWCIALLPTAVIPITMVIMFFYKVGNWTRLKGLFNEPEIQQDILDSLIRPDPDWGPALPEIRRKYSYDLRLGNAPEDGAEFLGMRAFGGEDEPVDPDKQTKVTFKDEQPQQLGPKENGVPENENKEEVNVEKPAV